MFDPTRPLCPIPHLGFCVHERCNFWDEDKQGCTADCLSEYSQPEETLPCGLDSPCTICWEEDLD